MGMETKYFTMSKLESCMGMGMMVLPWYRGNGESIHGSTTVAVTELTVDVDDRAVIKLLRNEYRMSDPALLLCDLSTYWISKHN